MSNHPSRLVISAKTPWPTAPFYRGRFPLGPTQIAGAASAISSLVGTFVSSGGIASFVQTAVKDPAPVNVDSYDTGSPDVHHYAAQAAEYSADTTAGSLLCAWSVVAYDGQYQITNISDPVNGNWDLVGTLLNTTTGADGCNCHFAVYAKRNSQPLLHASWSGTGAVSSGGVLTIGSGTGTVRIGQRILSTHTPTPQQQGVLDLPSVKGIVTIVSLLSGVLGAAGSTYQLNSDIGSTTFSSEAMTTRDFVSVQRFTPAPPQVPGDYPAAVLMEVSGSDNVNIYFSGHNDTPGGSGTDTLNTGALSLPNSSGLLVALGFNGGSNGFAPGGGGTNLAPGAGTGFTNSQQILDYDYAVPICTMEWQHFANLGGGAGTRTPTFSSTGGPSNTASIGIAFLDAPPTAQLGLSFSWEPPTQNVDNSGITTGEVTGFEVGVRASGSGSAGTYSVILPVDGPFTSADLITNIQPALSTGTYFAAVRAAGPTPGTWSNEATFTV